MYVISRGYGGPGGVARPGLRAGSEPDMGQPMSVSGESSDKGGRELREEQRTSTLKPVKILLGGKNSVSIIDAVLLDSSPHGVRLRTAVPVAIPEWVSLKLRDGDTHRAQRRWQRGEEIGLKLAESDSRDLLDALIAGLSHDQRRALIARIEASMVAD
jgi:hypothetical protein